MKPKRVIYCPNDKVHPDQAKHKILLVVGDNCIFAYCSDSRCANERGGTWTKVEFSVCGKKVMFDKAAIKLSEMPRHYHFDLAKEPISVESN